MTSRNFWYFLIPRPPLVTLFSTKPLSHLSLWLHLWTTLYLFPSSLILLTKIRSLQIHGWARKSQQSGFSLIPVPHDPFALPITKNSDPVRGPIFVELVRHLMSCCCGIVFVLCCCTTSILYCCWVWREKTVTSNKSTSNIKNGD